MTLTTAQRELLEDKFVLWDRASRQGPMDLREYNRRAADALKSALAICSAAVPQAPALVGGEPICPDCGGLHGAGSICAGPPVPSARPPHKMMG